MDIVTVATNLDDNIEAAVKQVKHVHDTLESAVVTPDNVDTIKKLVADLTDEVESWSRKFTDLSLAFLVYKNSTLEHVRNSAMANPYGASMSQSLVPFELS